MLELHQVNKGKYTLSLFNDRGQLIFTNEINHTGGSATQTVELSRTLPAGIYRLKAINEESEFAQTILIR